MELLSEMCSILSLDDRVNLSQPTTMAACCQARGLAADALFYFTW